MARDSLLRNVRKIGRYYAHQANVGPALMLVVSVLLHVAYRRNSGNTEPAYWASGAALVFIASLAAAPHTWQHIVSAGLPGLVLLMSPIKASNAGRTLLLVLTAIAAILPAFILAAAPVAAFPKIRGRYGSIGMVSDVWAYETSLGAVRKIPVQIWYPSARDAPPKTAWTIMWTPGSGIEEMDRAWFKRLMDAYAEVLNLPRLLIAASAHLTDVRVPVTYGAPLSREQRRWPVLFYSHGLFGTKSSSQYICLTLVSHGFVVVGIDHPGCSILAQGATPEAASPRVFNLFKRFFWLEPLGHQRAVYEKHLHTRHDDVLAAARVIMGLDRMRDQGVTGKVPFSAAPLPRLPLPTAPQRPVGGAPLTLEESVATDVAAVLGGRLDSDRLGCFGHSFGGASAVACVSTHGVQPPAAQPAFPFDSPSRPIRRQRSHTVGSDPLLSHRVPGRPEPVFRAAVCLDPWLYPLPAVYSLGLDPFEGHDHLTGPRAEAALARVEEEAALHHAARTTAAECTAAPTLFVSASQWHLARQQLPYSRAVIARHRFSHLHCMPQATHLNLVDIPLVVAPWVLQVTRNVGRADPERTAATVGLLTALFFKAHLYGDSGNGSHTAQASAVPPAAPEALQAEATGKETGTPVAMGSGRGAVMTSTGPRATAASIAVAESAPGGFDYNFSRAAETSGATAAVKGSASATTALLNDSSSSAARDSTQRLPQLPPKFKSALPRLRTPFRRGNGAAAGTSAIDDMAFETGDPFKELIAADPVALRLMRANVKVAPTFKLTSV